MSYVTNKELQRQIIEMQKEIQLLKQSLQANTIINVSDNVEAKENLINNKPWFNGTKRFSSVKVNAAPLEEPQTSTLAINVADDVGSGDVVGG